MSLSLLTMSTGSVTMFLLGLPGLGTCSNDESLRPSRGLVGIDFPILPLHTPFSRPFSSQSVRTGEEFQYIKNLKVFKLEICTETKNDYYTLFH